MRAIIDIFLAIIFSILLGSGSIQVINKIMKQKALVKVQQGLSSLEIFTQNLTEK